MHTRTHGLDGLEDLVLNACLENLAYDAQCEDSRAAWMFEMIRNATAYPDFSSSIIAALGSPSDEYCLTQLCDLAALMGKHGDAPVAEALRAFVWSAANTSDELWGSSAIITLDGVPAAIKVVQLLGAELLTEPDQYVSCLDSLTDDKERYWEIFAELQRLAPGDAAIAAYVAVEQERIDKEQREDSMSDEEKEARRNRYRAQSRDEHSAIDVIGWAVEGKNGRFFYKKFGQYASQTNLDLILERLRVETDPQICRRLLWVFQSPCLERIAPQIWELAHNASHEVRNAAFAALAFIEDPRVAELGRERLRDEKFSADDYGAIELLALNYEPGDEDLILAAIERLPLKDDDDAHAVGSSVQEVCDEVELPALAGLAQWIYETNPCTICRREAVKFLLELESLPPGIAKECLRDASSSLQDLVRKGHD